MHEASGGAVVCMAVEAPPLPPYRHTLAADVSIVAIATAIVLSFRLGLRPPALHRGLLRLLGGAR
jgi:hypothetical protein